MADPIMQLNLSIDESLYYALWYEQPEERQPMMPRITPPPHLGTRPPVIPYQTTISASYTYLQRADKEREFYPSVGRPGDKFIRPTGSDALGPHSYLFVGQVVASDHCALLRKDYEHGGMKRLDEWMLTFIVDCGIPLEFSMTYEPEEDKHCITRAGDMEDGTYVEGLVTLSASWLGDHGLYQRVIGTVAGMKVLELDPSRDNFGKIADVPFGYRLSTDPDCTDLSTVFLTLDVNEIGSLAYRPFPARAPDCPEPDYPGMVHMPEENSTRVVELGRPINLGEA